MKKMANKTQRKTKKVASNEQEEKQKCLQNDKEWHSNNDKR